jgi:hypothetical protein
VPPLPTPEAHGAAGSSRQDHDGERVDLDNDPGATITEAMTGNGYGCVVIGGGFAGPREYIDGALSDEDLTPLREAGCSVRVVAAAGHVMMWDNLDGFATAIAEALGAHPGA